MTQLNNQRNLALNVLTAASMLLCVLEGGFQEVIGILIVCCFLFIMVKYQLYISHFEPNASGETLPLILYLRLLVIFLSLSTAIVLFIRPQGWAS